MYLPYLLSITLGLCLVYVGLFYFYQYFFQSPRQSFTVSSLWPILAIIAASLLSYWASGVIHDKQLSNRVLHAFGGGFSAFLVSILAARTARIESTRTRIFIFSFLVVIALGVGNEMVEFFLQKYTHFIFSPTVYDTWFDLLSNMVGALIAAGCFMPLIRNYDRK